jgi:hypothetical protein
VESIRELTRDFEVCGSCGELRGPFADHVQRCACDARTEERWPGFDFNTLAELCQVCGCDVLRSGSRYSVWLCPDCKPRVLELRAETGRLVLPVGRHSITNGFALPVTAAAADEAVGAFCDRLRRMGRRINRLGEWAHKIVGSNLAAIGLTDTESVPLPEYLDAVRDFDRSEALAGAVGWMADQPA